VSNRGFLLDTHVLLWALDDNEKFQPAHREIFDSSEPIFVSAVSILEIAIKKSIGKAIFDRDILSVIRQKRVPVIPISETHAHLVGELPFHHRDPFDRLLIAQALVERMTIMTVDREFAAYGVPLA
jgi:PIN domain nuclease of toxin-antitoxin system